MLQAEWPEGIGETLAAFGAGVCAALGANGVALYVFGSLCMGDFNPASSDIDFLGVVEQPLSPEELAALTHMHHQLAQRFAWGSRLEGGYAVRATLRPWGIAGEVAAIEPGQALQPPSASDYSADNMLAIRQHGRTLWGSPPELVLPPVNTATLVAGLREYLAELLACDPAGSPAPEIADWVLNVARCLFGIHTGELSTKPQAAQWLGGQAPALQPVLAAALVARWASGDAERATLRAGWVQVVGVAEGYRTSPPAPLRPERGISPSEALAAFVAAPFPGDRGRVGDGVALLPLPLEHPHLGREGDASIQGEHWAVAHRVTEVGQVGAG